MQADQIAALEASMQNMAGLEATVNDVDSALTDMATCIAGYASGDMDDMDSTMMPTEPVTEEPMTEEPMTEEPMTEEPTMMPTMPMTDEPTKVPSMNPTAFWLYEAASEYDGAVCADGDGRTFKAQVNSLNGCANRCSGDAACHYFAFRESNMDCIGCEGPPMVESRFTTEYVSYRMNSAPERRQLSELEILRAENAALKEALAQVRRN